MANKKKQKLEKQEIKSPEPRANRWKILLPAVAVIAVVALVFLYLRSSRKIQSGAYKDFNVLMITLDTTRADHLPMYGYDKVKTPNLDALADESYIFEDAIAHVPLTLPSHTSMLTGLLPISHGIRDNAGFFLDEKVTTLPEVLKANGYSTSAFVSAFVLDSRWKLNQGFDHYYDNFDLAEFKQVNPQDAQRPAEETVVEAEHWLESHTNERFFCWVHFYDPHDPYEPPEPFKTQYSDQPYDGEIAYTDVQIGKLLDKLDSLQLRKKTIIVITGDHGEGLGEHGELSHAQFIYNSTQHIPLLVYLPGRPNDRVKGLVRHIDLFPTILELLGIPQQKEIQGRSFVPLLNGGKDAERVAYSESIYAELHYGWSPIKGITTEKYKYIDAPRAELYDRINDPAESRNLIQEKPEYAKVLRDQLDEIIAKYSDKNRQGPQQMDPETEEKLRALGYIGGTVQSTEESRKIDPKDKIHLAQKLQTASYLAQKQQYQESNETLAQVFREDPAMPDAHFIAGINYIGLKDFDKSIDELMQTIAQRPQHTMALYNIGYAYERKGENDEALDWFLKVLQYEPTHLYASLKIAHLYRIMNKPEEARPYFLQAMETYQRFLSNTKSDKAKTALHSTIGEIYFGAGDLDQAEQHFRAAIDLTPDRKGLHYNLASIYEAKGNLPAAMDEYRKETEVDSENFKAFNNLGLLYRQARQLDRAALCFQRVVQLLPKDARGYLLLASTYKEMGRVQEANAILQQAEQTRSP